jgi:hypothetical protein
MVNLMGIWVSTRDLSEVGCTVKIGRDRPRAFGGDDTKSGTDPLESAGHSGDPNTIPLWP